MANTGNVFPTVGANDAGIGATAWSNPGNIVSDNTTDAICVAAASSQYLVAKTFGFAIPTNATINGIVVRIEASEHTSGTESLNIRLQNAAGALVGTGKNATISGTGKIVYTLGTTADTWSASPTPAMVDDVDFGVRFWFTTAHEIRVDYATIALEYTVPAWGISTETSEAVALQVIVVMPMGVAAETEEALALELAAATQIAMGLAAETNEGLATSVQEILVLGLSSETSAALGTIIELAAMGLSLEGDTALNPAATELLVSGVATETDAAFTVFQLIVIMGLAEEANAALPLNMREDLLIGSSSETDDSLALALSLALPTGEALESDEAFTSAMLEMAAVGRANETDMAIKLNLVKTAVPGAKRMFVPLMGRGFS